MLWSSERFQPRSYLIRRLSMIVRVNIVLNRTVVDCVWRFDNLCAVVIFRVKVSCITSIDGTVLNLAINSLQEETDYLNNVFWHNNSLWLWRWLPHSLSKRQSLPTTTVLFSTMLNLVIMLKVLINLSCLTWSCAFVIHKRFFQFP